MIEDTAERGIPPEKVAKAIAHALESKRPKTRYLVGLDAKVQARLKPLIPTPLFDRIVARQLNLWAAPGALSAHILGAAD